MPSAEDRIQRVEAELDQLRPSLADRLERLEKTMAAISARPPLTLRGRFLAWMGAELPKFLAAAVLLAIGWGVKDSVDLSLKQRQLDLSYAKEMQGLLQKMAEPEAERGQLYSAAAVLASYGEGALPPLLSELRHPGLRASAAIDGISTLALVHRRAVCETLPIVLSNRSRQFDWQSQLHVVRVLGENDCRDALGALKEYRAVVSGAQQGTTRGFAEVVRELPNSPEDTYPRMIEGIDRTIDLLSRSRPQRWFSFGQ